MVERNCHLITRVLVVEDEESFSYALSYHVPPVGHQVAVAGRGHRTRSAYVRSQAPTWCCST